MTAAEEIQTVIDRLTSQVATLRQAQTVLSDTTNVAVVQQQTPFTALAQARADKATELANRERQIISFIRRNGPSGAAEIAKHIGQTPSNTAMFMKNGGRSKLFANNNGTWTLRAAAAELVS